MNKISRWEGCCLHACGGRGNKKCTGTKGFVLERDSVTAILL